MVETMMQGHHSTAQRAQAGSSALRSLEAVATTVPALQNYAGWRPQLQPQQEAGPGVCACMEGPELGEAGGGRG